MKTKTRPEEPGTVLCTPTAVVQSKSRTGNRRSRGTLLRVVIASVLLTLVAPGVARAHVAVSPEEVPAGSYEKFTVTAPTEKEMSTTGVRVEVPEGFTVSGVRPVPGWEYEFEEDGGDITAIAWSGGEIRPRELQEFAVQIRTPDEPGEFAWKSFQTYEDGSVVEWAGPEDSEGPASVVRVVAGDSSHRAGEPGSHSGAGAEETLPDTGGTNPLLYAGLGALALVALLAVLPTALRRHG